MSKVKLNSHVLHPQIKAEHCNAESAKLTNHDTAPTQASTTTTAAPTSNNKLSESFKGATGMKAGSDTAQKSGSVTERAINFFKK